VNGKDAVIEKPRNTLEQGLLAVERKLIRILIFAEPRGPVVSGFDVVGKTVLPFGPLLRVF
jgi:hypothetical protein